MIYVTGDTHGKFKHIEDFTQRFQTNKQDVLIILGDVGLNYYLDSGDTKRKQKLSKLPLTFFCIKGNHELHADQLPQYKKENFWNGVVYVEPDFPNIFFAKDGETYDIPNYGKVLAIGGAYSIDKFYRLENNQKWFDTEQPDDIAKARAFLNLALNENKIDYVFTHTCPLKYEPREWFLPNVAEDKIDKSTEKFLDLIEDKADYKKWYCGHYHGNKKVDKIQFLFNDIVELER